MRVSKWGNSLAIERSREFSGRLFPGFKFDREEANAR